MILHELQFLFGFKSKTSKNQIMLLCFLIMYYKSHCFRQRKVKQLSQSGTVRMPLPSYLTFNLLCLCILSNYYRESLTEQEIEMTNVMWFYSLRICAYQWFHPSSNINFCPSKYLWYLKVTLTVPNISDYYVRLVAWISVKYVLLSTFLKKAINNNA